MRLCKCAMPANHRNVNRFRGWLSFGPITQGICIVTMTGKVHFLP